jgi:IclR family transcriptional regulator, acetate operon repressor
LETGVLTRDDRNRYLLGVRVGTLVEGFTRQLAPSEHLGPIVRDVARETGEIAYASGWWGGEISVLAVARGANPIQAADVPRGYAGDAHARASGKLLLAFAPQAVREAYLGTHKLSRLTPNTITTRAALRAELGRIREQGYAVDNEEFVEGLCCLAVPLDAGYSPFVLAVSCPRERFLEEQDRYRSVLQRIAGECGNGALPN